MKPHMNGEFPPLQTPAPIIDRSVQPLALVLLLAMAAVLFFVGSHRSFFKRCCTAVTSSPRIPRESITPG